MAAQAAETQHSAGTGVGTSMHPDAYFTIGHSTLSIPDFARLLQAGPVRLVVDVRSIPKSRANPQFNEADLRGSLSEYQVGYRRIPALGGLRKQVREVPRQVNGWWENQSFHNYADHALGPEFRQGLAELIDLGRNMRLAIMCSEAVWWRCHRRIIADHLLARGEAVYHLMNAGSVVPARLSKGARVEASSVTYPACE